MCRSQEQVKLVSHTVFVSPNMAQQDPAAKSVRPYATLSCNRLAAFQHSVQSCLIPVISQGMEVMV